MTEYKQQLSLSFLFKRDAKNTFLNKFFTFWFRFDGNGSLLNRKIEEWDGFSANFLA